MSHFYDYDIRTVANINISSLTPLLFSYNVMDATYQFFFFSFWLDLIY